VSKPKTRPSLSGQIDQKKATNKSEMDKDKKLRDLSINIK